MNVLPDLSDIWKMHLEKACSAEYEEYDTLFLSFSARKHPDGEWAAYKATLIRNDKGEFVLDGDISEEPG